MTLDHYKRFIDSYIFKKNSHLSFWHGMPYVNRCATFDKLGQYYMPFRYKAKYNALFDKDGIPLLDYRGNIGPQYNPIAISQYGLAHYNIFKATGKNKNKEIAIRQADWLTSNLVLNSKGIWVWMHNFDWRYVETLKAPWYSGLAQGQGISLLTRIYKQTGDSKYLKTAEKAYISLKTEVKDGGVIFTDDAGNPWIEEYIVSPPSHILNGFMWALFGVYDYYLLTGNEKIKESFDSFVNTLILNLQKFDTGYWSLYDLTSDGKNLASPFYHILHLAQLEILYIISQEEVFEKWKKKWDQYLLSPTKKGKALLQKALFKVRRF
jgi:rhamnogalacturonyl hydrolase YesR